MNDDEPESPSPQRPVGLRDIRLIDDDEYEDQELDDQHKEKGSQDYSSVGLSVAKNDQEDFDDAESAPLDSQASDTSRDVDLQLINEKVREGGLALSEETIQTAKILLPDGD